MRPHDASIREWTDLELRVRAKRNPQKRVTTWPGKYGLTLGDYEALSDAQGGNCAICLGPDETGRRLAVDHCHETGKVRGLLCGRCNAGLGFFRDAPNVLRQAAEYLYRVETLT